MPILRRTGRKSLDAHFSSPSRYKKRDITDFCNTDYKEYAKYVIATRCCPGLDGLKVGGRKAVHGALCGAMKQGQTVKFLNLIGDVYKHTLFMHGDAGLTSSIFTNSAEFLDNLHVFDIEGQHGHLRAPDAQASPRYLSIRLSKFASLLKEDYDLLEFVEEEGEKVEPKVYLPLIPLALCKLYLGLAPGIRSCNPIQYNPLDIIDCCTETIKTGEPKTRLRPWVTGIREKSWSFSETSGRWTSHSTYNIDLKHDTIQITDLPFDITFKIIENTLENLVASGQIKDWKNYSHDDRLDYRILFEKGRLSKAVQPDNIAKLEKDLKLVSVVSPCQLNIINEAGKMLFFETEHSLIKYFVNWRLGKYRLRKDKLVRVLEQRYKDNSDLCRFIDLVNSGKIKVQNRKKSDLKKELAAEKLPATLLAVEISKLTDEEKAELQKKNKELQKELEYIKATSIEDMYLNDLKRLKKELAEDFKPLI